MKGKLLRIIALLSSLIMLFSLVACTGNKNDETTTANTTDAAATEIITNDEGKTEVVTVGNKTDETDTTNEDKTSEKEETTSEKTSAEKTTENNKTTANNKTTKPASTTKKTESAPVNGTIAEIVSFYNNAANRTKAQKNFSANKKELTKVVIDDLDSDSKLFNSLKEEIVSIGNGIINRLTGKGTPVITNEVFVNGKPTENDVPKNEWLPIMESPKMSTLTPDGVKSATCKKDGDGYIVTIVLKTEKGTLKKKPPIHASCVNYLRLEVLDLGPLNDNIKQAEMNYIDSTNSGTKFVAKVNKNNLLDYMNTYMTIKGGGTGKLLGITATASLHGTYTAEIKFKW